MKTPRNLPFPTLLVTAALAGATAHAATILAQDNFTGSSGTGVATVSNAESTGVGTYSTVNGTNGMSVTTVAGFGSGNVLSLSNSANTYYREFDGASSLTLNSLGLNVTLRLVFDVRFSGTAFAGADNFSFGFVDSSPANSVLYANLDLAGATTGDRQSEFKYRLASFNMGDAAGTSLISTSFTESVTAVNTSYIYQLDVTKQGTNAFLFEYYRDGVLTGSKTDTTASTAIGNLDISGIAFRQATAPNVSTLIDNVTVSIIPEPSTGLLTMVFGTGLLLKRRRTIA